MTIATCPRCSNTGALGERYCDCPAAAALRARLDADPRLAEARARIDRLLEVRPAPLLASPLDGREVTGKPRPPWWRPFARRRWDRTVAFALRLNAAAANQGLRLIPLPTGAPADVQERIRAYNAVAGARPEPTNPEAN